MRIEEGTALTFDDVLLKPAFSSIQSRSNVDLTSTLVPGVDLALPILSANMDTVTESSMAIAMATEGGVGVIHRFLSVDKNVSEIKKVTSAGYKVGASIGVTDGDIERAIACIEAGASFLVLDIAHAHSANVANFVTLLKEKDVFNRVPFIGGNIATAEGAKFLIDLGFSAIKSGIGSGSICSTRIVTGFGVPQFSAILDCAPVCLAHNIPLISDGGIRTSGDIVKCFAAGASAAMLGSLLGGTEESPGPKISRNGSLWKNVRGMASLSANVARKTLDGKAVTEEYISSITPEGVEAFVPYKGPVNTMLKTFAGGIRSGLSYAGAKNLKELREKARFIRITGAGLKESHPHDVVL